jgi:adenylyltransferase/sulfurtransferase
MKLSRQDLDRYDRQILISEIGRRGQEKLTAAKVFIAGAGGLGSPAALYLTAAGVGKITLVDYDRVALSNLNRQILHGRPDIGKRKVASARAKLNAINPRVDVQIHAEIITVENTADLIADADIIIDALDNLATRYLLNRAAVDLGIPFVHGAVNGFEGRILTVIPGRSACLRCMYRGPVPSEKFPVIGVAPAVIGALQATETIKTIVGIGDLLIDRLVVYDGLKLTFTEFKLNRNPNCDHCGHLP